MKRGFAARKGTGASLLPAANASLLVLQLYTAVAREIAAVKSGFYFTIRICIISINPIQN